MAHRYRWIEEHKICLVRYEGTMDGHDFIAADSEVFGATRGAGVRYLFDMRDVHITGGAATARVYATWLSESNLAASNPGAQQAIVVENPEDTGLSMLMATISDPGLDFRIFSTLEGACGALDIPIEVLDEHRDLIPA